MSRKGIEQEIQERRAAKAQRRKGKINPIILLKTLRLGAFARTSYATAEMKTGVGEGIGTKISFIFHHIAPQHFQP